MQYQPRLNIKGSPGFAKKTKELLDQIAYTDTGKKLLLSLAASGKIVTIAQTFGVNEAPPDIFRDALAEGEVLKWQEISGEEKTIVGTGLGSGMTVKFNLTLPLLCVF